LSKSEVCVRSCTNDLAFDTDSGDEVEVQEEALGMGVPNAPCCRPRTMTAGLVGGGGGVHGQG
jgi:hypothetical protein